MVSGSSATTCIRPGTLHAGGDLGHQRRVELAVQGARGGHRHREVGALVAGRAGLDRRRRHDVAPVWAASSRTSGSSGPVTSVAPRRTTASFSRAMSRHRRAEPARVLEPDVGEHHDRRAEHVGGVVAAAEAGLDDGDLDALARELGERGGGQQLELRDAVVPPRACGRPWRRPPRRAARPPRRRRRRGRRRRSGSARRTRSGAATGTCRCARRGPRAAPRVMRAVDDLPLVPTTWIARKRSCGLPSTVSSRRMRSSPKRMPNSSSESRWASASSRRQVLTGRPAPA